MARDREAGWQKEGRKSGARGNGVGRKSRREMGRKSVGSDGDRHRKRSYVTKGKKTTRKYLLVDNF